MAQRTRLLACLALGACHYAYQEDIWDSKQVKALILEQFGVEYHQVYTPRLLKSLGYSRQVPRLSPRPQESGALFARRAFCLKKAQEENRKLLYVDEAAFYLLVKSGKVWAKKGHPPVLWQGCYYAHLSAISAISEQGEMYFQIQPEAFTGEKIVSFLKALLAFWGTDLLIIWQGAKIHSSKEVKEFLQQANQGRIFLAQIPPYVPNSMQMSRFGKPSSRICSTM